MHTSTQAGHASTTPGISEDILLPVGFRLRMEHFFGADFGTVRLHVGELPVHGAAALACGERIHVRPDCYRPGTPEGEKLLAHELAHVIQQRAGRVPAGTPSAPALWVDPVLEAEAEALSELAVRGGVLPYAPVGTRADPEAPAGVWQPATNVTLGGGAVTSATWTGNRPGWTAAILNLYPLLQGEHRRHIIAWDTLKNAVLTWLQGKSIAEINHAVTNSGLYAAMGVAPVLVPPLGGAAQIQAVMNNILTQVNSCPVNVWPGGRNANMSLGFKIRGLKTARRDGGTRKNREISDYTFSRTRGPSLNRKRRLGRGDPITVTIETPGGMYTTMLTRAPVGAYSHSHRMSGRSQRVWTHVSRAHEYDPPKDELSGDEQNQVAWVLDELRTIYNALSSIAMGMAFFINPNVFYWLGRLFHLNTNFLAAYPNGWADFL